MINGERFTVAGTVAMDQVVIDVGDAKVTPGDQVQLFGSGSHGEPTADDWANACGTINYEIVTRLGPRLPRRHMGGATEARCAGRARGVPQRSGLLSGWPPNAASWRASSPARTPTSRSAVRGDDSVQVVADDGDTLYAEIDEPTDPCGRRCDRDLQPRILPEPGHVALPAARPARQGAGWSSGTSARTGAAAGARGDRHTIDQLGRDLARIIEECAPTGRIILVGHSMGGMTVMGLAAHASGPVR